MGIVLPLSVAVIIFIYKVVLLGDPARHKDEQNSTAKTWAQMTWYSRAASGLKVCLVTLSGKSISIQGYMAQSKIYELTHADCKGSPACNEICKTRDDFLSGMVLL